MLLAALVACGHFLAFFALTAALVLQLALIGESMSIATARRIQRADLALGLSAILLLVFGFLRVIYFEKGSDYYFGNLFFQLKLGFYFTAFLISLYPSAVFRRWNSELKQDAAPELDAGTVARLKKVIHWELLLVSGMLVCASLMARGFGG